MATKKTSPKLTAGKRRQLKPSEFALPGRDPDVPKAKGTYPIDTPGRARTALGRSKTNASPGEQDKIRKAVARKYPGIKVSGMKNKKTK